MIFCYPPMVPHIEYWVLRLFDKHKTLFISDVSIILGINLRLASDVLDELWTEGYIEHITKTLN